MCLKRMNLTADNVCRAIRTQFPELQVQESHVVKLDTSGTVNTIFRLGSALAARMPLHYTDVSHQLKDLNAEQLAIARFAQDSPFPTTSLYGIGSPEENVFTYWSIQTWIEGTVPTANSLSHSEAFASDIAHLISRLRNAPTYGQVFSPPSGQRRRGGNLLDHDEWMSTCFERSTGVLDVAQLRGVWTRLRDLPGPGSAVMCHGDLTSQNLVVQGDRLVGVLDCGNYAAADPALDLVVLWHMFDSRVRDIVREELSVADGEWNRGMAWAFEQAMGLVWYYKDTNKPMSDQGRITLERVLAQFRESEKFWEGEKGQKSSTKR